MSGSVKVLIVDDSSHVPKLVEKAFQGSEFEVAGTATDGEEGIRAIQDLEPHIVLLDMLMPKLDGIEVLKRMRDRYPKMKFVILSSSRLRKDVMSCKEAGAQGYITKPFKLKHLVQSLRNLGSSRPEMA